MYLCFVKCIYVVFVHFCARCYQSSATVSHEIVFGNCRAERGKLENVVWFKCVFGTCDPPNLRILTVCANFGCVIMCDRDVSITQFTPIDSLPLFISFLGQIQEGTRVCLLFLFEVKLEFLLYYLDMYFRYVEIYSGIELNVHPDMTQSVEEDCINHDEFLNMWIDQAFYAACDRKNVCEPLCQYSLWDSGDVHHKIDVIDYLSVYTFFELQWKV